LLHEIHHQHAFRVLSQKTFAISFLADVYLNFLARLVNVCACSALIAFCFQYLQVKHRCHHLLLIPCDWEIHCHLCCITVKKSKPECVKFVEIHMKFLKLWSAVFHSEQGHHYRWPNSSLFIVNICSSIFEHCTPLA
jgi:hypothetical protein